MVGLNRRDIAHRLAGVAVLLGACASTLVHREVWLAHVKGPATALEGALGLLTFCLASFGLLLVIGGARLRDDWKRDCDRAARKRARPKIIEAANDRIPTTGAMDALAFANGRAALATYLVMRAQQAAAQARRAGPTQTTTMKYKPGAQK